MKNRSKILSRVVLVTLGALSASGVALADRPQWAQSQGHSQGHSQGKGRNHHDRHYRDAYARVVDVDPIVRRMRVSSPERQCWNEDRPVYGGGGRTVARSTVVGGLIGAAVGHRIGHHSGSHDPVAIVGGSLVGAAIGNSIGASRAARNGDYRQVGYETVQRCEVRHRDYWEERIDGYRVTYMYEGRRYTTRMPYDPGRRLRVDVNVRPVFERY